MYNRTTLGSSIWRSFAGAALIVMSVATGFLIANLIDHLRPGTLLQGRNFHGAAILIALLIACSGVWWYRAYAGHVWTMLAALGLVEVLICALILLFSGSYVLDRFFLDWFLEINTYVALPWLGAAGLGFFWVRKPGKSYAKGSVSGPKGLNL